MTATQLPLPLPVRTALGRDDFFVSQANADAVGLLDMWPNWPNKRLALIGPEGSGKTHLAAVWRARAQAQIVQAKDVTEDSVPDLARADIAVEDVDAGLTDAAERALFHLYNLTGELGASLVMTARRPPAAWGIRLPDLASRVQSVAVAQVYPPDDALLAAVLVKLIEDRQLRVPPNVISYVLPRMERSFAGAQRLVATLDNHALSRGRPITTALAREVLDSIDGAA